MTGRGQISPSVPEILLCIDRSFILGAGALVISLVHHNRGVPLRIHVCAPGSDLDRVRERLTDRITDLLGDESPEFILYASEDFPEVDEIEKTLNRRCAMQCVRLVAVSELRVSCRYLLYLDADTLCTGPLTLLDTQYPAEGEVLTASEEKGHTEEVCGVRLSRYFISGIMLIDLKAWKERDVGRESAACAVRYRPKYPDQDALNAVLESRWHEFDKGIQGFWEVRKNTAFIHFVGAKPWHPWSFSHKPAILRLFRESAKLFEPDVTCWLSFKRQRDALICFEDYSPRFAFKWAAKRLWARGHVKGALYCMFRHYAVKIRQKGLIGLILLRSNTRS